MHTTARERAIYIGYGVYTSVYLKSESMQEEMWYDDQPLEKTNT